MKIGIIGAGNIGQTLTRRLTALGHEVTVANSRGPETLAGLAGETGAKTASAADAASGADLAVVTVPMKAVGGLPAGMLSGLRPGAPVVDTCNYYPRQRDGRIGAIEEGSTESRYVESEIGHPVVKAFNCIMADHLMGSGTPPGTRGRIALPVAGDEADAKATVMRLVDELGFDPIDAGGIDESWRQQPGSPVYTNDLDAAGVERALAEASPERTEEWRA